MKQGHFHVHTSRVSRSKGYSSVAAAAYQSGQQLTHEAQRQFSLDPKYELKHEVEKEGEHHKDLNKGHITDELRDALKSPEKEPDKSEDGKEQNTRTRPKGIVLSEEATVSKDTRTVERNGEKVEEYRRGHWTITDGDNTYQVKQHRQYHTNPETGKRETVGYRLDVYADKNHSYITKEDVGDTWLKVPDSAPEWMQYAERKGTDISRVARNKVWEAVEGKERNRDAVSAIKIELSFLRDLTPAQNKDLANEFIARQFTDKGYIVDAAIHHKEARDGKSNDHIHLLVATRPLNAHGEFAGDKDSQWNRGLNDTRLPEHFRYHWAVLQNWALEQTGAEVRVDPRSYAEQQLDKEAGIHVGQAALNIENRQQARDEAPRSLHGNQNRDVAERNVARAFWKAGEAPFRYSEEDIHRYYEQKWQQGHKQYEGNYRERAKQQGTDEQAQQRQKRAERKQREANARKQRAKQHHTERKTARDKQYQEHFERSFKVLTREERDLNAVLFQWMNTQDTALRFKERSDLIATSVDTIMTRQQQELKNTFNQATNRVDTMRYRAIYQDNPTQQQQRDGKARSDARAQAQAQARARARQRARERQRQQERQR